VETPSRDIVDNPPRDLAEMGYIRSLVRGQLEELRAQGQGAPAEGYGQVWVTCPCGRHIALVAAYRCLDCGLWFCRDCAHRHFSQSAESAESADDPLGETPQDAPGSTICPPAVSPVGPPGDVHGQGQRRPASPPCR
jgi:hypothetical protein